MKYNDIEYEYEYDGDDDNNNDEYDDDDDIMKGSMDVLMPVSLIVSHWSRKSITCQVDQ